MIEDSNQILLCLLNIVSKPAFQSLPCIIIFLIIKRKSQVSLKKPGILVTRTMILFFFVYLA